MTTEKSSEPTPDRVVKVLEGMYLLDVHDTNPQKFADDVYMFCHIAGGTCSNPHTDWQERFVKVEKDVLEALMSPSQKQKLKVHRKL